MQSFGVVHQTFSVRFEYAVAFTRGVFSPENELLARCLSDREPGRRHRMFVVVDAGVAKAHTRLRAAIRAYTLAHADRLELVADPVVVPGGEDAKRDPATIARIHEALDSHGVDRQSFVVVIGGGAVLDAVGFAAATAHRGIRTVRLPTTVLAQNDAGIGVKNGVNAFGVKNYLGTFHPPYAVINDVDFLATLQRRDAVSGFAEAIKVALLRDPAFFAWMEQSAAALAALEPAAVFALVRRCAELHLAHIAQSGDPFEMGSARPLDFGHWSAHKLESLSHHQLRHGEAVAIGLLLDCRYAVLTGLLAPDVCERVERLLAALGLPRHHPSLELRDGDDYAVLAGLREFQEHLGGDLTLTLLRDIGAPVDVHEVHATAMRRAIASLSAPCAAVHEVGA